MASAGTFTTFALMLNCLPLGFSRNCINGIRGANKRCEIKLWRSFLKNLLNLLMNMQEFCFLSDVDNKSCKSNHLLLSDIFLSLVSKMFDAVLTLS